MALSVMQWASGSLEQPYPQLLPFLPVVLASQNRECRRLLLVVGYIDCLVDDDVDGSTHPRKHQRAHTHSSSIQNHPHPPDECSSSRFHPAIRRSA